MIAFISGKFSLIFMAYFTIFSVEVKSDMKEIFLRKACDPGMRIPDESHIIQTYEGESRTSCAYRCAGHNECISLDFSPTEPSSCTLLNTLRHSNCNATTLHSRYAPTILVS